MLLSLLIIAACGGGGGGTTPLVDPRPPTNYSYTAPVVLDDGWAMGSLLDSTSDLSLIEAMINRILAGEYAGIDAIALAVDGRLVLEERFRRSLDEFDDWIDNRDLDRHCLHSTSKSFVSALVGIAMDQGYLTDTRLTLVDFFPYAPYANWDDRKRDISLEDTLTMRLGLEWDEWTHPYGTPENSLSKLFQGPRNLTRTLFNLPMASAPGSEFVYNTGASMALGELVELAVGMALEDYAQRELFDPLQITEAAWKLERNGIPNTGSGLFLTTRSMLKFGQLYLQEGLWKGRQILSREWVQRSTAQQVALNWGDTTGYGYQWWLGEFRVGASRIPYYSAQGYGGQFIFVIPSMDVVIAFHGRNYGSELYALPFRLTERYILPGL